MKHGIGSCGPLKNTGDRPADINYTAGIGSNYLLIMPGVNRVMVIRWFKPVKFEEFMYFI